MVSVTPAVIIGLGGTGARVLNVIKKFKLPPVVKLLEIDADEGSKECFEPGEFIHIGIGEQVRTILNELSVFSSEQVEQVKRFLPTNIPEGIRNSTQTLDRGAAQVRILGRLCLYHNAMNVYNRLNELLADIVSKCIQDAVERGYEVDTNLINVFVVTSVGGGCGSGIFIDVAYMLRDIIMNQLGTNCKIHGILVTPSAFTGLGSIRMQYVKANAYAALMELNYYMENAKFECNYGGGFRLDIEDKPFDYVHIVCGVGEHGVLFRIDQIAELIANIIMNYINSEIVDLVEGLIRNMRNFGSYFERDGKDWIRVYSSFSSVSMVCRFDALEDYYTYRLILDSCNHLLRNISSQKVDEHISSLLTDLKYDNICNNLGSLSLTVPEFKDLPTFDEVKKVFWFDTIKFDEHIDELRKKAEQILDQVKNDIKSKIDICLCSEYSLGLAEEIIIKLENHISNEKSRVEEELKGLEVDCESAKASVENIAEEYEKLRGKKMARGKTKRDKLNELLGKIKDYIVCKFEYEKHKIIMDLYEKVNEYILNRKNYVNTIKSVVDIIKRMADGKAIKAKKEINTCSVFERIVKIDDKWINNTYNAEIWKTEHVSRICFDLKDWDKRSQDDLFRDLVKRAKEIVTPTTSNFSIVKYLRDHGKLNDIDKFVKREGSKVQWRLEAFVKPLIQPNDIINILLVNSDDIKIVGGNIAGAEVKSFDDRNRITLICFKYTAPMIGISEFNSCKDDYESFEGSESIFHTDYSKFGSNCK
jgi:ElaB/YqjD/DUF883 family membrane-anchored ribosome-binding protein